jgi:Niemann-Pick C1 protein
MRDFASRLGSQLGLDVYSYSVFHIFFEQYLTIAGEAMVLLGTAAVAVFLICRAATGKAGGAGAAPTLCGLALSAWNRGAKGRGIRAASRG